jgi:hypothetical protein
MRTWIYNTVTRELTLLLDAGQGFCWEANATRYTSSRRKQGDITLFAHVAACRADDHTSALLDSRYPGFRNRDVAIVYLDLRRGLDGFVVMVDDDVLPDERC